MELTNKKIGLEFLLYHFCYIISFLGFNQIKGLQTRYEFEIGYTEV